MGVYHKQQLNIHHAAKNLIHNQNNSDNRNDSKQKHEFCYVTLAN